MKQRQLSRPATILIAVLTLLILTALVFVDYSGKVACLSIFGVILLTVCVIFGIRNL